MSASLRLVGLGRDHAGMPALAGVDLDVPAGACVGVLGPSGSGKTTLLRLVAGLDAPSAGAVHLDGTDQAGVPPERRGAALVSQRPQLLGHLSVRDNVGFARRVAGASRRAARADAQDHLDLVGLGALADRRPAGLSGGQAQRVALARALAARPRVLLLDEPFGALDTALRTELQDLLRRVRAELAPTVVLVTHDQAEAAALADTVAVLVAGTLRQHATPAELYTRPASLAVHRVMGGLTEVAGEVRAGVHRSDLGGLAVPGAPEGPGVLVCRHESVRLVPGRGGVVREVRPRGPRSLVVVAVGSAVVHAEVPPGAAPAVGDGVGVEVPAAARWVVAPAAAEAP